MTEYRYQSNSDRRKHDDQRFDPRSNKENTQNSGFGRNQNRSSRDRYYPARNRNEAPSAFENQTRQYPSSRRSQRVDRYDPLHRDGNRTNTRPATENGSRLNRDRYPQHASSDNRDFRHASESRRTRPGLEQRAIQRDKHQKAIASSEQPKQDADIQRHQQLFDKKNARHLGSVISDSARSFLFKKLTNTTKDRISESTHKNAFDAENQSASFAKENENTYVDPYAPSIGIDKERQTALWHHYAVKAFSIILTAGLAIGLLFFLRPSISESENRELTKFPHLSMDALLSGEFTNAVSTWYADTYPFREQLISINQWVEGLYGFEASSQMYGNSVQADDIPTNATEGEKVKKDPVAPETYDSWNLEKDIQGQIMQGLYVNNGAVYATYGFTQEAADDYINAVNSAADKLDGITQVHSILIPNNSGVLLDENELAALGGSNQAQAIEYYYNSYNDKVKTTPTMEPLVSHKNEYIFFRTDHHWTALGAYFVYEEWCENNGKKPHTLDQFEEQDFSPFLGSYYSQLQLDSLAQDPDTVQAWIPQGTNEMKYTDVDGNTIDWNVIRDVSEWDQGTLYNCFVGGDQPWAEIHNPAITDGSSCVIVKESYGNAFAPWLVDHYEHVYIADFRYTNTNVVEFCKEHNVTDLILLNNISIIGSVDVAGKISSIL